jgi:5-methylcytosine-specific restriction endonuclease McrA
VSSAYIPVKLRRRVAEQARHRCGYCLTQEAITGLPMEFDHLRPLNRSSLVLARRLWMIAGWHPPAS